jgi:hypothetical protein
VAPRPGSSRMDARARAPPVEAEQDGSIRIQDLTKVVMARRRLGLAKERLVPFEAARNVAYADDCPCAFHRISAVGLTSPSSATAWGSASGYSLWHTHTSYVWHKKTTLSEPLAAAPGQATRRAWLGFPVSTALIRLGVHRPSRLGRNPRSSPKVSTDVPMGRGTSIGVRHTCDPRVQREHEHRLPWRVQRVRRSP